MVASRAVARLGLLRATCLTHLVSVGLMGVLGQLPKNVLRLSLEQFHPTPGVWLAGLFGFIGYVAVYLAYERGKLTIVGPLCAAHPALTVVLFMVAGQQGEQLPKNTAAGLTLLAVMALSVPPKEGRPGNQTVGIVAGGLTLLSFGVMNYFLVTSGKDHWVTTLFTIKIVVVGLSGLAWLLQPKTFNSLNNEPETTPWLAVRQVMLAGVLDTFGCLCYGYGLIYRDTLMVSVAYSASTVIWSVLVGALVYKDTLVGWQWATIAFITAGLILVGQL
jgi:drug/metabolite transporter (DMT)-like permease